jgi:hypothetical protein
MQLDLSGIPLPLGLFDFVLQDRHLGPTLHGMGRDTAAEANPVLGHAQPVAPKSMALGQRAPQDGILGHTPPITLHSASFCHLFVLPSLNLTK